MLIASATVLCGCSGSDAPQPIEETDGKDAYIVMTLSTATSTPGLTTRASGHDTSLALENENKIDIDGGDYRVLIFSKDGRLLERFMPTEFIKVESSDYKNYTISGPITQTDFMANADGSYDFRIMVLANWESLGGKGIYDKYNLIPGSTLVEDVVNMSRRECFALWTGQTSTESGWQPFNENNKGIPMFGFGDIHVEKNQVEASRPDAPVNVGNIPMLRSMTKIEIIDNITGPLGNKPVITGVSINRHLSTGTFIPDIAKNPFWGVENYQVTTPTLPIEPQRENNPLEFFEAPVRDGMSVYAAYLTEQDIENVAETDRPVVSVMVIGTNGTQSAYQLQLSEYKDGKPSDPMKSLLRNHIYRFEIVGVNPAKPAALTVKYMVCPWDKKTIDIPEFE